jgi:site-specific DNA-cytosine methylase
VNRPAVLSLFSGVGGFDIGFHAAQQLAPHIKEQTP